MDGFSFSQLLVFSLKKVLGAVLTPSSFIFLLALVALLLLVLGRRRGFVRLAISCFCIAAICAHPWFSQSLLKPLEHTYPSQVTADPAIARIAVLGSAYLHAENRPPTATISLHGQGRLVEGVRLYHQLVKQGIKVEFIVSGYSGNHNPKGASYVAAASEFVQSLGVAGDDITKLDEPRTTAEEARALAKALGQQRFYLVTSGYHMPRAMALMQAQGLQAVAAPTAIYTLIGAGPLMLPKASNLSQTDTAVHEYLGITWAYLVGNIEQLPELAF